ncbi:low temperature requirement protein A [Micromonospora sp. CPCC 205539]|uniref:low temperature requirement protein A n=1 Tax=Micromonospora sp. CPCC 205539 TaxID=3122408 RepID=UPI002FF1E7CC
MRKSSAGRLLRKRESSRQASSLELFFDLTFIFALMRLSSRLVSDPSWLTVAQTLVLLGGIWWIWIATAWSTDWFDPNESLIQRLVVAVMFVGLLMSAAVTQAFGAHGIYFAGGYVLIHLGRAAVLLPALRGHRLQRRTLLVAVWFAVSAVPWLVGAFLPAGPRLVAWIVALSIDFTAAYLGWPVPTLGRVAYEQLRVVGDHLSERYGQISLVSLGELILATGAAYVSGPFDVPRTGLVAVAFVNAVVLWRIYFLPEKQNFGRAIDSRGPRLAVFAAYTQLLFIAGVVCIAVGDEISIGRTAEQEGHGWGAGFFIAGATLVLAGRVAFETANGARPWGTLLAIIVILALTPALLRLPPVVALAATTLVLAVIAFTSPGRRQAARQWWQEKTQKLRGRTSSGGAPGSTTG